jgi:O-antigen/teichoic acid export membrane protein
MTSIRRAFLFASGGRYIIMATNLCSAVVMARLLTPAEYGLYVIGSAVFAIAEAIRELGSGSYLIQQQDLTIEKIRSMFTVNLLVTALATVIILFVAGSVSNYYATPDLERYVQVALLAYLMGPFVYPTLALMNRGMEFGSLAIVGVVTTLANAIITIVLALLGFRYMSFAWAGVASAALGSFLVFALRPDFTMLRFSLTEWRGVLKFGVYDSAISLLIRMWDYMPYLILGRLMNAEIVGLWQRAMWLCLFPERVILAGFGAVALSAFSEKSRQGVDLQKSYLRAIACITAVQWPAQIMIVLLAHPLVLIVLGRQWLEAVPLIQVLGFALMFTFPTGLNYPTLVAKGAISVNFLLVLAQGIIATAIFLGGARYGARAAAVGMLVAIPINAIVSMLVLRAQIGFRWGELAAALGRSAVTTAICAMPLALITGAKDATDLSVLNAIAAVAACAPAWLIGLRLTDHPLWLEVSRAAARVRSEMLRKLRT